MAIVVRMTVLMRVAVVMRVSVGVVVRVAVLVAVPMMVVLVMVVVAAAAGGVVMAVGLVLVRVIVAVVAAIIGAALGPERAGDLTGRGAEAADHFEKHVVVADIQRGLADLGGDVAVADMPGDLRQPDGIVGRHLDQALRGRRDADETAVLQLHRVAVVEDGGTVEVEQELEPAIRPEGDTAPVPGFVIERQGVGDPLGLHGGPAKDGGGTDHRVSFPLRMAHPGMRPLASRYSAIRFRRANGRARRLAGAAMPGHSGGMTSGDKDGEPVTAAYLERAALAYLERYASSRENLRRVLIRKARRRAGSAPDAALLATIDGVAEKAVRSGLVDDRAYAAAKLHGLLARGTSVRGARLTLAAKGLDRETVAAALDEAAPDDVAQARRYARRRRLGAFRAVPDPGRRDRDLAVLGRAGFSYRAAVDALDGDPAD